MYAIKFEFFYEMKYSNKIFIFSNNSFQVLDPGNCNSMHKEIHGAFIMYLNYQTYSQF